MSKAVNLDLHADLQAKLDEYRKGRVSILN